MTALRPQLQRLTERINTLALRERVLIFMAVALALIAALYGALIDPLLKHQRQVAQEITATQGKITDLHRQIQAQLAAGNVDPNAPLKARLEQLKTDSTRLNQDLHDFKNGLITPQQMPMLLKDILRNHHSLRLISMKTLPAQRLSENKDDAKTTNNTATPEAEIGAYKHGFEITLQGGYLDMLGYLSAIEASPWRVFWGSAHLDASTYPKTLLTIKLYTLSMDQEWLIL
jgi:MSHA biogenesis protein MshJ